MRSIAAVAVASVALCLGGCVSNFGETHYIETVDTKSGQVANVFRLTVSGTTGATNTRYLAGYYDERAVDVFFNEVNAGDISPASHGADKIFSLDCSGAADAAACKALQDKQLAVIPYGGDPTRTGAFLMILSTNTDAIAQTIGSIGDSQSMVSSVVAMATQGQHAAASKLAAQGSVVGTQRSSIFTELNTMVDKVEPTTGDDAAKKAWRTQAYLQMLRTVAAGVDSNAAPTFSTLDQAKAWFAGQPRGTTP